MLVFTYSPPKIRDKISLQQTSLHTATTSNYLLKILLKKKICVMSPFYLKFWVLLKVTMRDPLGASIDVTDTQFLNHNHPHSYPFEKFEVISRTTGTDLTVNSTREPTRSVTRLPCQSQLNSGGLPQFSMLPCQSIKDRLPSFGTKFKS